MHQQDLDSYEDYVVFYWGNPYSGYGTMRSQGLVKGFHDLGYFFKYQFDFFEQIRTDFHDYFVPSLSVCTNLSMSLAT